MENNINYEQSYNKALIAGKNRDYTTAVNLLTSVVTNTDKFPHALLYLGRSYHALGKYNRAVQILEFYNKTQPVSEAGHFFLARTYLSLGYNKRAIRNLKIVLEKNTNFFPARSLLGLAFLKLRKADTAVFHFEKALKLNPDNERIFTAYLNALLIKAIKLFHGNFYFNAEKIFGFIQEHRNDSILPHIYLARIYQKTNRDDLSLKHYDMAQKISPQDPVFPMLKAVIYLRMGDSNSAYKELGKTTNLSSQQTNFIKDPELLLKFITITLFQKKRFKEAIMYGKKILKSNYRDADIHALIAESYLNLGEYIKVKNHYLRCIEIKKQRLEFHYGLAMALWNLKQYKELINTIKKIRLLNPKDTVYHYFHALCLSETGDSPEEIITTLQNEIRALGPDFNLMFALGKAYLINSMPELSVNWFLRTLKLKKTHKESLLFLIQAYNKLGKVKEEKKSYFQYLNIFSDDYKTRRDFLLILMKKKDYKDASQQIIILMSLEPKNKGLKKNLAFCYLKLKKYDDAALIYRELLKDEPKSVQILRFLIFCLDRSGSLKPAIILLERACQFFKDNPSVLLPLGVLYSKTGEYEKAGKTFREVIGINSKDWRAYKNLGMLYKRMGNKEFAMNFLKKAQKYKCK